MDSTYRGRVHRRDDVSYRAGQHARPCVSHDAHILREGGPHSCVPWFFIRNLRWRSASNALFSSSSLFFRFSSYAAYLFSLAFSAA